MGRVEDITQWTLGACSCSLDFDAFPIVAMTSRFPATSLWSGVVSRIWPISELSILSPRRLPFRHPGEKEAAGGFEPPYKGFADPRLNLLATPP